MLTKVTMSMSHILDKFSEILQYPIAWLAGIGLFVAEAFAGGKFIVYMVVIVSVIDLICGISVSIKNGSYTRSELMKATVEKLFVYGLVLVVFLSVDNLIEKETTFQVDVTAGVVGVIIVMTEAVSFTASLLILFPTNFFLRLFQRFLRGELARKLGCNEEDVDKVLASARRKIKNKPARDKSGKFIKKS